MDLNDFFSLDTESIIAGVLITSLARCTEYPGSLGFLFSRSQAEISYVHLSPVTFSWACPSAPVRLPSLCLDHAWACSLAMQRGKIPFCMMSELKHQSKAEHSLREALNSLSTNNSRNEEHLFTLLLLSLRAARHSYLNSPFCRGCGCSIHSAGHLRTGFWSGLNEQLSRSGVRSGLVSPVWNVTSAFMERSTHAVHKHRMALADC